MIRVAPLPVPKWEPGLLQRAQAMTNGEIRAEANVYCTLANYPELFLAWLSLGAQVLRRSSLSPRQRELAILRATALANGTYPFTQHVRIGAQVGLDERCVAGACAGPDDQCWGTADRLLLRTVDELAAGGAISDASWNQLSAEYSTKQILDIVAVVAFYRLAAWMLNLCGTPLDADQTSKLTEVTPAETPHPSAYSGLPRIQPVPVKDWPDTLLQETSEWPRFKTSPELRHARVYGTLANHADLFCSLGPLMAHILSHISLPERQREIVIVRACCKDLGAYPYRQHMRIGRTAGLEEHELTKLSDSQPRMQNEPDQLLIDWVDELHRTGTISTNTWQAGISCFDERQLFDVTLTAGFYGLISMVLNSARTELEEGEATLARPAA